MTPSYIIIALALLSACSTVTPNLRDFTSDGCSLFVDGNMRDRKLWCECCFAHDVAYWQGGSEKDRRTADRALRECVRERTGNKALGDLMYAGVTVGGHPAFPTWYRWGYGWNYSRGYKQLTEDEQSQVVEKFGLYKQTHPFGYCGEKQGP